MWLPIQRSVGSSFFLVPWVVMRMKSLPMHWSILWAAWAASQRLRHLGYKLTRDIWGQWSSYPIVWDLSSGGESMNNSTPYEHHLPSTTCQLWLPLCLVNECFQAQESQSVNSRTDWRGTSLRLCRLLNVPLGMTYSLRTKFQLHHWSWRSSEMENTI